MIMWWKKLKQAYIREADQRVASPEPHPNLINLGDLPDADRGQTDERTWGQSEKCAENT